MKITAIRTYPAWIGHRPQLLVKVETDEGIHGWGESGFSSRERAVAGAVEHYAQFLIGRDPMRAGALWQEMYRSQYFEGGRVLTAAISAIDIALYDIKGKALGVPVYELLGGRHRDVVPTFASVGARDVPRMVELSRQLADAGWTCIRLGMASMPSDDPALFDPWASLPETARWMVQAREELGTDLTLGIDYHHRLSVAEAASFCQRMPVGTLDFLEEPIRDETPEAYETLRRMTTVPFAIGEEFASKWQFLPYLERGLTQYARVDICNVGGFTEAMKVAGWAEAHYIDLMPHNPLGPICTAATVHLAAAVPNFAWLECRETLGEDPALHDSPVFIDRPKLVGASYPVPTAPGLGIDIDEAALQAVVSDRWSECPHLHRSDGSHTNW
ncbi:MAG TPA: mandelate racemase/muconate lactonizing enzyme family protein [Mycobacteriales bacterium]|nr:mandelate racemase/muconate lactonizing enzyme family protein [Mycobacteriales bacterium]